VAARLVAPLAAAFDEDAAPAAARQGAGGDRAGRSAADDQDIRAHGHPM